MYVYVYMYIYIYIINSFSSSFLYFSGKIEYLTIRRARVKSLIHEHYIHIICS